MRTAAIPRNRPSLARRAPVRRQREIHRPSTQQMADELHLTVDTIRNPVRRLVRTLGDHTRPEAIVIARCDSLLVA